MDLETQRNAARQRAENRAARSEPMPRDLDRSLSDRTLEQLPDDAAPLAGKVFIFVLGLVCGFVLAMTLAGGAVRLATP